MNIFRIVKEAATAEWHRPVRAYTWPLPSPHARSSSATASHRRRRPPPLAGPARRSSPINASSRAPRKPSNLPRPLTRLHLRRRPCQTIQDYATCLQQLIYSFDQFRAAEDTRDAIHARLAGLTSGSKVDVSGADEIVKEKVKELETHANAILESLEPGTADGGVPNLPQTLVTQLHEYAARTRKSRLSTLTTALHRAEHFILSHNSDPTRNPHKPSEGLIADLRRQKAAIEKGERVRSVTTGEMSDELRVLCAREAEDALRSEVVMRQLRAVQEVPVVATNERRYVDWEDHVSRTVTASPADAELTKRWDDVYQALVDKQIVCMQVWDKANVTRYQTLKFQTEGEEGANEAIRTWHAKRKRLAEEMIAIENDFQEIQQAAMAAGLPWKQPMSDILEVDSQIWIFDEHLHDNPADSIDTDPDHLTREKWKQWVAEAALDTADGPLREARSADARTRETLSTVPFGEGRSYPGADLRGGIGPTAARKARIIEWQEECAEARERAGEIRVQRRLLPFCIDCSPSSPTQ